MIVSVPAIGIALVLVILAALFIWWSAIPRQMNQWDPAADPRYTDLIGESAHPNAVTTALPPRLQVSDEEPREKTYVVTGGCGFIGSWVTRYLTARGEKVRVLDIREKLPRDLREESTVTLAQIDLSSADEGALREAIGEVHGRLVIYHCAAVVKYHHCHRDDNFRNIAIAKLITELEEACVIFIGDYLNTVKPGKWVQTAPLSHRSNKKFISPYAESMEIAERLILDDLKLSGSIRPQGLVSGHYGDAFLSPALDAKGGLLHSANVPLCIIHVEDVVRAGLKLENLLLSDPSQSNQVFTISNSQVTTLERVYSLIGAITPFRTFRVSPLIVYICSLLVGWTKGRRLDVTRRHEDSLLTGAAQTLTLQRFRVLQIGQLPNDENTRHTETVLGFRCLFTIRDVVDTTVHEYLLRAKSTEAQAASNN